MAAFTSGLTELPSTATTLGRFILFSISTLGSGKATPTFGSNDTLGADILGCKETLGPTILGSIDTLSHSFLDELPRLCSTETLGLAMLRSAALTGLMAGLE